MENFLALVAIGLAIYALDRFNDLKKKHQSVVDFLKKLQSRITELESGKQTKESPKEEEEIVKKEIVKPPAPEITIPKHTPPVIKEAKSIALPLNKPVEAHIKNDFDDKIPPPKVNSTLEKLEKQFVENWTGILGAVIMVVGVGFLGIYAALKISAFGRFLLISGFSAVLGGIFFYLHKKENWLKLALWLRSSAGAIFLFACLGSAGIPGLQWIEDPFYGLLLLSAGILVNLYLGYIGGNQVFASLHVVLGLVSLCIAPQSQTILIIAAIVTLVGIAFTYREKWDFHLLTTISSFFLFHLFWYDKQEIFSLELKIIGIITVVAVSIAVALVHYRKVYVTKIFDKLPFCVHLINWFYFGIGVFLHSTGAHLATFFLAGGSIAAFLLARHARKIGINWLYNTDTLIAQMIAVLSIISLTRWRVDDFMIIGLIFTEALLFVFMMQKEKERLLFKIGTVVLSLVGIVLAFDAFFTIDRNDNALILSHTIILLTCSFMCAGYIFYSLKNNSVDLSSMYSALGFTGENIRHPVMGILSGAYILLIYFYIHHFNWGIYPITLLACACLFLRYKLQSIEFGLTSIVILLGVHFINWSDLIEQRFSSTLSVLTLGLPLLLVSSASSLWSFVKQDNKYISWPGVYLFTIQLIIISFLVLNKHSELLPGTAWLLLSVVFLLTAKIVRKKCSATNFTDRFILHAAYFFLLSFFLRHIYVNIHSQEYFYGIKTRCLIEVLAVVVLFYWAIFRKPENTTYRTWNYIHPLFPELILAFCVLSIGYEVDSIYLPVIWVGIAFVLAIIGNMDPRGRLARLKLHSIFLYWIAAIHTALMNANFEGFAEFNFLQNWVWGLISISTQFVFLTYFYKKSSLNEIEFPKLLSSLKELADGITKQRNGWLIYPLIVSTGLFLFNTFDRSVLTLLWVVECSVIFVISIILKEKHFRYVALGALALCIVRLVFYDLSQASTLARAMVFLGVGVIMLGMNSVYNKYKSRFEQ